MFESDRRRRKFNRRNYKTRLYITNLNLETTNWDLKVRTTLINIS